MLQLRKHSLLALLCAILLPAFGQQSNTFYLMQDVAQTNLLNPAVQSSCKIYIGIPGLSSSHVNYSNTGFSYSDLFRGDSWNIEGVADQLHSKDLYIVESSVPIISLGYKQDDAYFTFHVTERAKVFPTIPGAMARMAVYGNGPTAGEQINFDGFRPAGLHIREYSLGYSRIIGEGLTAGVRAKLIFGKANMSSGQSQLDAFTDERTFALRLEGDYTLRTSFPLTVLTDSEGNITGIEVDQIYPLEYMLNARNPGLGLDLGVQYEYSSELSFSASLLDLGAVRWRSDINQIHGSGTFIYSDPGLSSGVSTGSYLSDLLDSIASSMDYTLGTASYTSMMPVQLYLGTSYRYSDQLRFGLVNRNTFYRSKMHSSISAVALSRPSKNLSASLSWTWMNHSIAHIGLGLAWNGPGFQFHLVSDNILGFFFPLDTRTVNLRAGMNFMLACKDQGNKRSAASGYGKSPLGKCPSGADPKEQKRQGRKRSRLFNKR